MFSETQNQVIEEYLFQNLKNWRDEMNIYREKMQAIEHDKTVFFYNLKIKFHNTYIGQITIICIETFLS